MVNFISSLYFVLHVLEVKVSISIKKQVSPCTSSSLFYSLALHTPLSLSLSLSLYLSIYLSIYLSFSVYVCLFNSVIRFSQSPLTISPPSPVLFSEEDSNSCCFFFPPVSLYTSVFLTPSVSSFLLSLSIYYTRTKMINSYQVFRERQARGA